MTKVLKRPLSILLSLVLVLGLIPGMSLTAYAASHSITINNAQHGTVTATVNGSAASSAEEGATVTLTANPDEGYRLKSISGTYKNYYSESFGTGGGTKTHFKVTSTCQTNGAGWRLYNNGTVTVTSTGTQKITKVVFTGCRHGMNAGAGQLGVSSGNLSISGNTIVINNLSNVTSFTLTGKGNNTATQWQSSGVTVYGDSGVDTQLPITNTSDSNVCTFTMPAVATGNVLITAEFEELPKYTVTWKNEDGTTLETDNDVAEGTTPTYDGTTPTKANDDYHSYNFSGWTDGTNTYGASDTLPAVTGDVTYTAKYTVFTKQFTVFVKTTTGKTITANGVSGDTTVAELKDMVVEESGIPAAEQRLIFAGKEMENEKTLADYRIQRESTLHVVGKSYTITWKNDDGTVIDTTSVAYGTTPTYDGETPYKADGANCIYTFSGWTDGTNTYGKDETLPAVTANVTYTATFDATDLFVINDGVLTAYNGDKSALTTLTIPDEVTEISGSVFKNCTNLESVNLNNVVKVTGESFFGCSKLSSVIGTKLKYAGYRSFCTTTASLRTLTMRSGNNGADKKGLDSAFIVQAMVDAGQPTWYFYTVVRKGNDGNDFHYTAFNQTFLVEEGVEPFIESDYEAEQTASSGVNKSAIIYIKIDDENRTIKVKSNESNVSGYGPGTKILIDGVQYTIVEETGINYEDDNYIKPDDKVTVSDSDEGKTKFGLNLDKYFNMQILGVQLKKSIETKGGEDGIRFVTAVNSKLLKGNKIEDYGYIVVKAKAGTSADKIYENMDKLTYDKVDAKNRFSCYGSSNTISGEFGQYASDTDYKYVTLAITGTEASADTVAARFYVKTTDGEYHYADYENASGVHGGIAFNIADVLGNLK